MAAGLGFKDFQTGEVLTAADVDGYLMQGIWVFADATARDAAVTSPQEGNFAFLKDTNVTTYYTGSAWANVDTTGMTNPMTTTGDVIYSSSGSTPARLGLGTAGQILQVNSGATAPEWATPAGGGGYTLINTGGTTLTGASVTISSIPATYVDLYIVAVNYRPTNDNDILAMFFNGDDALTKYARVGSGLYLSNQSFGDGDLNFCMEQDNGATSDAIATATIKAYTASTFKKVLVESISNNATTATNANIRLFWGISNITAAISSITFRGASNLVSGTVYVYGVK